LPLARTAEERWGDLRAAIDSVQRQSVAAHEIAKQSGWGCVFSFRDPEGNVWDVAWKAGSEFDDRGGFIYP
jgi:hypothetical protein